MERVGYEDELEDVLADRRKRWLDDVDVSSAHLLVDRDPKLTVREALDVATHERLAERLGDPDRERAVGRPCDERGGVDWRAPRHLRLARSATAGDLFDVHAEPPPRRYVVSWCKPPAIAITLLLGRGTRVAADHGHTIACVALASRGRVLGLWFDA
jgi:hypothetical protein